MAGAISQPRQSRQFLFCLMKNPLLYRSAWPENSERFLMKTLGGAVLPVDVEDPFEQSGPTHARCLPARERPRLRSRWRAVRVDMEYRSEAGETSPASLANI